LPGTNTLFSDWGRNPQDVVNAAYQERVDLSAHGFYKTPDVTGFGGSRPFNYFTYGAAVSEVELDALTGDFQARSKRIGFRV
jgi:xanthine dehydrogenase/oxidase